MNGEEQAERRAQPSASDNAASGESAEFMKLKSSYESLRADYTRKCQKLRQLERALEDKEAQPPPSKDDDEESVKRLLLRYWNQRDRGLPTLMSGRGAAAAPPPPRPRNIAEAGELARRIIMK